MNRITITRRVEFDAAHRLRNHESQCRFVHGHRYVVEATFSANHLDNVGRVIDFGVVRDTLQGWVDTHWDHTLILHEEDKPLGDYVDSYTGQKSYYMPSNPTAENMAAYLAEICRQELFQNMPVSLVSLTLYETPNCRASVAVD